MQSFTMYEMGNTRMPAVMLNGPNMICFVAKRFADMRQTQNSIPKSIKDTLTIFPFILSCFLRGYQALIAPVVRDAGAKVRQKPETGKEERQKIGQNGETASRFPVPPAKTTAGGSALRPSQPVRTRNLSRRRTPCSCG